MADIGPWKVLREANIGAEGDGLSADSEGEREAGETGRDQMGFRRLVDAERAGLLVWMGGRLGTWNID